MSPKTLYEEPTWLQVGDRFVTKVETWGGGSSDRRLRTRSYGLVTGLGRTYVRSEHGWEVRPYVRATTHGRVVDSWRPSVPSEVSHRESAEVSYERVLRVLTPDEWARAEAAGWPFDFQTFLRQEKQEAAEIDEMVDDL